MLKRGPDFHFDVSGYSREAKSRKRESTVVDFKEPDTLDSVSVIFYIGDYVVIL